MPTLEEMNAEAAIEREERRHLENLAATIAVAFISGQISRGLAAVPAGFYIRQVIELAQEIRDEQARAGTEGKAETSEENGL